MSLVCCVLLAWRSGIQDPGGDEAPRRRRFSAATLGAFSLDDPVSAKFCPPPPVPSAPGALLPYHPCRFPLHRCVPVHGPVTSQQFGCANGTVCHTDQVRFRSQMPSTEGPLLRPHAKTHSGGARARRADGNSAPASNSPWATRTAPRSGT
jgi:hypothetical protein